MKILHILYAKLQHMRYIFMIAVIILFATGCSKDKWTYTIVAQNSSPNAAVLEIDDESYTVTQTEIKREVEIDKYGVVSVSLDYVGSGTDAMTLSIYRGSELITSVSGNRYRYVLLTRESAEKGGGGISSSGGASSGSGSSICGATTKDGTPCQRKVSGGGYCWQHD